jgi:SAM-dependent methyltransferase
MALPLTGYLSDRGRYEGFDISAKAINWCRKNITGRYPNFRFQAFNIRNAPYNPLGTIRVSSYRFPYEDETFDLIFLASVFTHMLPGDVKHYLSEIARVLKPGGRCLITYFLLNAESSRMIDKKLGTINFEYHMGDYRTINQDRPEDAMAYYEVFVRNLYRKHGLKIMEPVRYGSWCGRETYLSFQDIIIAVKAEALS